MPSSRTDLTNPPRRLPHIALPEVADKADVPTIWRRTAPILLFLHSPPCQVCAAFAERVAGSAEAIGEWDGRPLVIVPETTNQAPSDSGLDGYPFPILTDREDRLRNALRITPPAVVIADQWGEIYERLDAGEGHDFPEPEELVDWAQVITVKCPECEGEAF